MARLSLEGKFSRFTLVAIASILLVGLIGLGFLRAPSRASLNVAFYLRPQIWEGGPVVDSANLETTQEYYLLENLASSLLLQQPDGGAKYASHLIRDYSVHLDQIVIHPRTDAKWSDGSPILCKEIVSSLQQSLSRPSRHILALRGVDVRCGSRGELIFSKKGLVIESALHELSLADLAILKRHDQVENLTVTSGAYSIFSIHQNEKSKINFVELKKNPFHPMAPQAPERVRLFHAADLAKSGVELVPGTELPDHDEISFYPPQGWNFLPFTSRAVARAPQKVEGHFAMIHFLYFKKGNLQDLQQLAAEISRARHQVSPPIGARVESQIVPEGYRGRIESSVPLFAGNSSANSSKRTIRITLDLVPGHRQILEYFESILRFASSDQIKFEPAPPEKADLVMGSASFKGNMTDPLGSFSFLLSPPRGLISQVGQRDFERLQSFRGDFSIIQEVHQNLLRSGLVIPLFAEQMWFLLDKKWGVSRFNPFDMRVPFYDLRQE